MRNVGTKEYREKPTRVCTSRALKWLVFAAAVLVAITALSLPGIINLFYTQKNEVYDHTPDAVHGAWFADYFYREIDSEVFFDIYPELESLKEQSDVGIKYTVTEGDLGEYIGEFPKIDALNLDTGKAYHFKAYPNYLSLIIVKRGEDYTLYHADADQLGKGVGTTSDAVLNKLGLPDSVEYIRVYGNDAIYENTVAEKLFDILSGRKSIDPREISFEKWWAWCAEKGDVGVGYGEGGTTFASSKIRTEYAKYYGAPINTVEVKTDEGFLLTLLFDTDFNYVSLAGKYYSLASEEADALAKLLNIE